MKISLDLTQTNFDNVEKLYNSGAYASRTAAINALLSEVFINDYFITVNGCAKHVSTFMVSSRPYTRSDFQAICSDGNYEKKFITNFNQIPSGTLKRAAFDFIKACCKFINRKYRAGAKIGTVQNMSIYYPNTDESNFWHCIYVDVKYATASNMKISKYMQHKLRTRYVGGINFLWTEIQNCLNSVYGRLETYSVTENDLDTLINHINSLR